ncbi:MAG TPA: hypothetical protein VKR53_10510 [Puia sp.]|nr:hypothetical protein [Puia sp.]
MRRFLFLSAISSCMLFSHCRKSQQEPGNLGTIVGWNYGACATCGGFYFNPSNDTAKNNATLYALTYTDSLATTIDSLSHAYAVNLKPVFVYITWKSVRLTDPDAPSNWVNVTYIKKR